MTFLPGSSLDLALVDLGLPDLDGRDMISTLRRWSTIPVIVVSGREAEQQKVRALDAGADDYVTKPFSVEELLARVRAGLRRRTGSGHEDRAIRRFSKLEIDLGQRRVTLAGRPLHLTPREYALLEAFVSNPGKLLTHKWLLQRVWGRGYGSESQYLRVYIGQLRRKLGDSSSAPSHIATETGVGYRWVAEPED